MSSAQHYKETGSREIPKEWQIVSFTEVADFINGYGFKTSDWKTKGLPIVRIQNLNDPNAEFNYFDGTIDNKYYLENGDLLLSWSATLGVYVWNRRKAVLNQHIFKVIPKSGIDKEYLFYTSHKAIEDLKRRIHGSTMKHFKKRELDATPILLPPLVEQRGISRVLSCVAEAIQKTDAISEKAEMLKRGLMQKLLTRGIGHTKFRQTELGEIPKTWKVVKINQISKVRRGASPRPIGDVSYFSDRGRGWVRIADVTSTYKYLRKTSQYLSEKGVSKSIEVNPGALIMSICATIGKPIIVDIEACIHDGFVWFSNLSENVDTEYLFYLLQSKEKEFAARKQTGTQGNLNTTIVGRTNIPVPPLPEQQKIASILSSVDDKITKEKQRKQQLEQLKKGLMQVLLIGKVRVKVD